MEFVDGVDLSQHLARNYPLPVASVVRYTGSKPPRGWLTHANGVVHRDIKPANVLLDEKGTVKVLNMGLARLNNAPQAEMESLTKTGDVMGTVDYMAPEQAFNIRNVDGRADIYSLGCNLYRLITNSPIYDADSIVQKLMAHQSNPIPSLKQSRSEVSDAFQQVFEKMVAKRVEHRFQSMGEVMHELERVVDFLALANVSNGGSRTTPGSSAFDGAIKTPIRKSETRISGS